MTRRMTSLLAAVTVALAVTPAFVTTSAAEMTCNIPFAFTVGEEQMPAGRYVVSTVGNGLLIRGDDKGTIVMTNGLSSTENGQAKVVFEKIGQAYVLAEAWTGTSQGRELPRPRVYVTETYASNTPVERIVIYGS